MNDTYQIINSAAAAAEVHIPDGNPEWWQSLIDERDAAKFLSLSVRTMQGFRYRGGGPPTYRLSARCVRYRRRDLLEWATKRLRESTADNRPIND